MPTNQERRALIAQIEALPTVLAGAVADLSDPQLNLRSSTDPWTIRQLVHHVADSHMNAFIRMKLILTEEHPTLKPYDQDAWAMLADTAAMPVQASLTLLTGLHARWTTLLNHLAEPNWARSGFHPENGTVTLDDILVSYARHGAEHVEQIGRIRAVEGW